MKRRSFLKFLSITPALPLAGKLLTKEKQDDDLIRIPLGNTEIPILVESQEKTEKALKENSIKIHGVREDCPYCGGQVVFEPDDYARMVNGMCLKCHKLFMKTQ